MHPLTIEINKDGGWVPAATVDLLGQEAAGLQSKTKVSYDIDFALDVVNSNPLSSVSLLLPVTLEQYIFDSWPSFLLDLLPQGHAMRHIEKYYKIRDFPSNYWKILGTCPMSPPGNLRILTNEMPTKEDNQTNLKSSIKGFQKSEVIAMGELFLEHMINSGSPVSGSTGASGAAPKFLLREGFNDLWYADGTLSDKLTKTCWFVKFPRGKTKSDLEILQSEADLFHVARRCGLDAQGPEFFNIDVAFLSRFFRFSAFLSCHKYDLALFGPVSGFFCPALWTFFTRFLINSISICQKILISSVVT
jgi:serine/threonine-protein kinase HipA